MSRVRTMNFDALAASAPLDAKASTVRDGAGDLWEPKLKAPHRHWKAPPPPLAALPPNAEDLAGRKVGRLTVVRYHGKVGKFGRWLVRCQCGDYELRRRTAIVNYRPGDGRNEASCQACDYLRHIRWVAANAGSGRARNASDAAMLDELAAKARQKGGAR